MSVHENAIFTIISFAQSLLAVTKDYLEVTPEGSELDIGSSEAASAKDKAHLQMFFVTTNMKNIRPAAAGNVKQDKLNTSKFNIFGHSYVGVHNTFSI